MATAAQGDAAATDDVADAALGPEQRPVLVRSGVAHLRRAVLGLGGVLSHKVDRTLALTILMVADSPEPPHWNESNAKAERYIKAQRELK